MRYQDGRKGARTLDLPRVRRMLSQLSYTPISSCDDLDILPYLKGECQEGIAFDKMYQEALKSRC